ncbi:recombinase family protein [Serratia silvae]|uniref:Recombinase family protein n=1 Tax=Serratia silvae TaxID=2824122 RepID=A0ABT0KBK8_9GAMM|nr:recombinase family protein [Serratia silvae]MCL1029420.1 recombinase family protein [Serratia silvae]
MTKKRPHIYTRVSKAKQIEGSGLDEQTARIQQYLKDKQHLFEGEPVYWTDVGLSAYRNKNITDGQLGKFMELVDSGAIGEGDALIIYSLDRLSRRSAWDEVTIPKIVNSRCDIHDVSTPVVLKHDDPFSKIIMELIIQRGNNESKIKSERSTSGWEMRFDNMVKKGDIMTRRLPRWLDYDESCGYTLKEREVNIIRDIFRDYARGISSPVIAK